LDWHVKAIYGDSITPQRCEQIYQILKDKGFAASNVALGVGSFSFHAMEIDGEMYPFTRDTFQVKIAPQYMETSNGTGYPIFKAPKGCEFKKSYKGCCFVTQDWSGKYICEDGLTWNEANYALNHLQSVFKDGHLLKESSLYEIRNRLHNKF
jgi:nicotinamide phosphoribosyltransferase